MAAFTALALGLMAAGTVGSAVAQKKAANAARRAGATEATALEAQGAAQRVASESQAQLLDYNAAVAVLQRQDAIERGAEEESRFRSQVRGAIGGQRAGFAAGNVDVSFGSAVDVQADAAFLGELDALTIRTNAAREAWGYEVEAEDTRMRASIARKEGVYLEKAARTGAGAARAAGQASGSAGSWAAGGTLLGGLGGSLLQARYGFRDGSSRRA